MQESEHPSESQADILKARSGHILCHDRLVRVCSRCALAFKTLFTVYRHPVVCWRAHRFGILLAGVIDGYVFLYLDQLGEFQNQQTLIMNSLSLAYRINKQTTQNASFAVFHKFCWPYTEHVCVFLYIFLVIHGAMSHS